MTKTIYLPVYAKRQLETSDDASIWAKPIAFRLKPEQGFTMKTMLNNDTLEIEDVVESGLYHPNRDQALESTIEMMQVVRLRSPKVALKPSGARYRCFEGNDAACWAKSVDGKISVLSNNVFNFVGFGTVPKYFLDQERSLDTVLAEGAGIIINRKKLPLCDDSYDGFSAQDSRFAFTAHDALSPDKKIYKLFQDYDDGARGWALFTVKTGTEIKVVKEDHNDNVRDWMLSEEFLTQMKFDFDLKYLRRPNHDFFKSPYRPTAADFASDFHLDEKGKKTRA